MAGNLAADNLKVRSYGALLERTELNFSELYMRQIHNVNQGQIVKSNDVVRMGEAAVNNWGIFDGPDETTAKQIASARGMHMLVEPRALPLEPPHVDKWYCSLVIVFDGDRFTGSTLQVMGVDIEPKASEWGVIGGTGEFAMARGVIKREEYQFGVQKLTIHAFCGPQSFPNPKKNMDGPWGGKDGKRADYRVGEEPRRLLSVTIHSGFVVDALQYTYIDQTGEEHTIGRVDGTGGHNNEITLGPSDFIKKISGTISVINDHEVITSLTLVTNNDKTYGPFGRGGGEGFSSKTGCITAFVTTYSKYIESVGVYYA